MLLSGGEAMTSVCKVDKHSNVIESKQLFKFTVQGSTCYFQLTKTTNEQLSTIIASVQNNMHY